MRSLSMPFRGQMARYTTRTLIVLLAALCGVSSQATSDEEPLTRTDDPPVRELQWHVIESDHFRVHFADGSELVATTASRIAEEAYGPVTDLYDYRPPEKTIIVVRDHGDFSNGFAAYFQNRVEIWATNLDYEYRSTHDWLHDVVTHEFTHIVQLGASMKGPSMLPQVYFQWFGLERESRTDVAEGLPNTLISFAAPAVTIPMWFAEGVAQHQTDEVHHDWWDPHRDMILRTAILSGTQLSYRQMEGFYDTDGRESEMVYDHGYALVGYLAATYGDSSLRDLTRTMARSTVWNFDRALEDLTGKSAETLYDEWIAGERAQYDNLVRSRDARPLGERIDEQTESAGHTQARWQKTEPASATRLDVASAAYSNCRRCTSLRRGHYHDRPAWSPDGNRIAYVSNKGEDYHLTSVRVRDLEDIDEESNEVVAAQSFRANSTVRWFPDSSSVVFSRIKREQGHGWYYSDLVKADLDEEEAEELTKRWRATYPDVSPDGERIVFVHNAGGTTNLMLLDLEADTIAALTEWIDGTQVFSPRWSHDGTRLAFSISRGAQRDVAILRMEADAAIERVFASDSDDRDPAWSPKDDVLVFSSAVDGVFNLYEADIQTGVVHRITNVAGGAFAPDIALDGRIAYSSYEADGYAIRILPSTYERYPVASALFDRDLADSGTFALTPAASSPVDRRVPHFQMPSFLPRIGLYDGHLRLGAYAFTSDIWDDAFLLGGFWIAPYDLDYDAFLMAEIDNRLPWPLMLDAVRMVRHTPEDTVIAERLSIDAINYGLNSFQLALKPTWKLFEFDLHATYQYFDAEIRQTLNSNGALREVGYNYEYYYGYNAGLSMSTSGFERFTTGQINPQGYRLTARYDRWWNRFFKSFDTGSGLATEEYTHYNYNQFSVDAAYSRSMPWHEEHTLGLESRAMMIADAKVDSFFYEGIGGIIGLRGYTYYQLQGSRTFWSRFTYRMPVPGLTDIDAKLGPMYLDKIYVSAFVEAGRVWRDKYTNAWMSGFKRDAGAELRADLFAFYGYPSRLALSFARALDPAPGTDKTKVYLTLLFGYL